MCRSRRASGTRLRLWPDSRSIRGAHDKRAEAPYALVLNTARDGRLRNVTAAALFHIRRQRLRRGHRRRGLGLGQSRRSRRRLRPDRGSAGRAADVGTHADLARAPPRATHGRDGRIAAAALAVIVGRSSDGREGGRDRRFRAPNRGGIGRAGDIRAETFRGADRRVAGDGILSDIATAASIRAGGGSEGQRARQSEEEICETHSDVLVSDEETKKKAVLPMEDGDTTRTVPLKR